MRGGGQFGESYDLSADAVQGQSSVTLTATPSPAINVGDLVLVLDEQPTNDAFTYAGNFLEDSPGTYGRRSGGAAPAGGTYGGGISESEGSRIDQQRGQVRPSLSTARLCIPIIHLHPGTSCDAQVTTFAGNGALPYGAGFENFFVWGATAGSG